MKNNFCSSNISVTKLGKVALQNNVGTGKMLVSNKFPPPISFNPVTLSRTKFGLFQTEESLQTTILNLIKMVDSPQKRVENTVGKGEIACYELRL